MAVAIGFTLLFVLIIIGMPVAFALIVSGAIGLFLVGGASLAGGMIAATPLGSINAYEWVMLPMFVLMANLIMVSRIGDDIFDIAKTWVGRVPGGAGWLMPPRSLAQVSARFAGPARRRLRRWLRPPSPVWSNTDMITKWPPERSRFRALCLC